MDAETSTRDDQSSSFIGSMEGTMEIVGDIISPIDEVWEAEVE